MICDNIKMLCESRGISVSRLEKELGFGNSTIAKWAICSPSINKVQLVAAFFGCTVDELLAGKEEDHDLR